MSDNGKPTNAICIDCGSMIEDPETGSCVNGHFNWLEERDDIATWIQASKKLGLSIEEIYFKIHLNQNI